MGSDATPTRSPADFQNPGNPSIPRLALRRSEAAEALGLSDESFDRYVRPHLRVVRANTLRLYPVSEIERWLDSAASAAPLEEISQ